MDVLTFETWKRKFGFDNPPSKVSFETFTSEAIVEDKLGNETLLTEHLTAEKDVLFWYEVIHENREKCLRSYFDRRLGMEGKKLGELGYIFSGSYDVTCLSDPSLRSKTPLSRYVRQLHWDDICDTHTGSNFTEFELIQCIWMRGHIPKQLIQATQNDVKRLMVHLSLFGENASIFPPETIASIIRHDLKAFSVFCPVMGWSSYLLGFSLSRCSGHFIGIDANPKNVEVMKDLAYSKMGLSSEAVHIFHGQTETFLPSQLPIPIGGVDGVFFSPPYYDRERYFGEGQSHCVYSSYSIWLDGFYLPVLRLCFSVLKIGGKMAIVVSDQEVRGKRYPLVLDTVKLSNDVGFGLSSHRQLQSNGARGAKHLEKKAEETLLIFEKK